ncbi:hypothetical protein [Halobacterium hubeiense]|uniref:hypothetical protein n=1 Tax=Halobacterium hubeiense TaxID=1407499 RepID=UPI001179D8F2|nr:hypothetical protein [Halobacterium hubeiense]
MKAFKRLFMDRGVASFAGRNILFMLREWLGVNRRAFLSKLRLGTVAAVGGTLAGCSTGNGQDNDQDSPPVDRQFRYFFSDESGTLGGVGDHNQPPDDVNEWQIIENTRTEDEWRDLRLNDVAYAEAYMAGETVQPTDGTPGTPAEIVTRTQELYEATDETGPVAFTNALIAAEDEVSSADFPGEIVPNIAEHAISELGYNFPAYSLTSTRAVHPVSADYDGVKPETVRETGVGAPIAPERVGTFGEMRTTLYLLMFKDNDGFQIRYVNRPGFSPWYLRDTLRKPSKSVYREPLSKDYFSMTGTQGRALKQYPEHFVTALDYRKAVKMRQQGLLKDGEFRKALIGTLLSMVDNGGNDESIPAGAVLGCNGNRGYQIESLTHEFGTSIEDFIVNPSSDRAEQFVGLGRAIYLIFETEFGEDYKGDPKFGYNQPLKITGTLAAPELYHRPEQC